MSKFNTDSDFFLDYFHFHKCKIVSTLFTFSIPLAIEFLDANSNTENKAKMASLTENSSLIETAPKPGVVQLYTVKTGNF